MFFVGFILYITKIDQAVCIIITFQSPNCTFFFFKCQLCKMDDGRINCATRSTCSAGRTRVLMNAAVSAAGHGMHSGIGSRENPFHHPTQVSGVISGVATVLCRHLK